MAYCMAMVLIFLKVVLMEAMGMWNVDSSAFIMGCGQWL
jgi:hypothetical protein